MNQEDQAYRQARAQVREIRYFYSHLAIFAAVNLGLFIVDLLTGGGTWFYWSLLGWGIGLAVHAFKVYGPLGSIGRDWEERKTQEILERRRQGGA